MYDECILHNLVKFRFWLTRACHTRSSSNIVFLFCFFTRFCPLLALAWPLGHKLKLQIFHNVTPHGHIRARSGRVEAILFGRRRGGMMRIGGSTGHFSYGVEGTVWTIPMLVFQQLVKDWQDFYGIHIGDILVRYTVVGRTCWRMLWSPHGMMCSLDHMWLRLLRLPHDVGGMMDMVVMMIMSMFSEPQRVGLCHSPFGLVEVIEASWRKILWTTSKAIIIWKKEPGENFNIMD